MTETHEVVPHADTLPVRQVLHPAVERLLEKDPTPETLEKILALQERFEDREAEKAFTQAMVALKRDLPVWIRRDQVVDYGSAKGRVRYTHVSLAAAMEAVLPALTEHGFSLTWEPTTEAGKVKVTAVLAHRAGHKKTTSLEAPPDTSGSKSPAQAVASTVTLLERYTALSLLGIATADMAEDRPNGSGADESEKVDTTKNLRAVAALQKAGKTKAEAETFIGRPLPEWTAADLARLRQWIEPEKEEPAEDPGPPVYSGGFAKLSGKAVGGRRRFSMIGEDGIEYHTFDPKIAAFVKENAAGGFTATYDESETGREIVEVKIQKTGADNLFDA